MKGKDSGLHPVKGETAEAGILIRLIVRTDGQVNMRDALFIVAIGDLAFSGQRRRGRQPEQGGKEYGPRGTGTREELAWSVRLGHHDVLY